MKLNELVVADAIVPELTSSDRDEVIAELIDALVNSGVADASIRSELLSLVLERESKGSTGFGKGVAVPHVKHAGVGKIAAAVGLSSSGVEFNALDKQPVYSVFLLLSPADKPEDHLQAMEVIFKNLSHETFRKFLRQASDGAAVVSLLEDADEGRLAG
ncbi:MAG: PTS sugar transporter subunit IIA [Planctomycetota bacterium]